MTPDIYADIKVILTDIEGTVTSPSYRKDVLVPYISANLADYVWNNEPELIQHLDAVREDERNPDLNTEEVVEVLLRYLEDEEVTSPLEFLQDMVSDEGYISGRLQAHVYDDVLCACKRWQDQGCLLYIYSSLSVQEQRLFLAHSQVGDISKIFSGLYDTKTGGKRLPGSYEKIAAAIGVPMADILFLTDNIEDAVTASNTGMKVIVLDRKGCLDNTYGCRIERDFDNILPEVVPA
ncbi:MAG: acireductone synthase [Alphaproteobacteria bacterium]|nr:acireductone synthase [Alphaproteobacteria bacterium]